MPNIHSGQVGKTKLVNLNSQCWPFSFLSFSPLYRSEVFDSEIFTGNSSLERFKRLVRFVQKVRKARNVQKIESARMLRVHWRRENKEAIPYLVHRTFWISLWVCVHSLTLIGWPYGDGPTKPIRIQRDFRLIHRGNRMFSVYRWAVNSRMFRHGPVCSDQVTKRMLLFRTFVLENYWRLFSEEALSPNCLSFFLFTE